MLKQCILANRRVKILSLEVPVTINRRWKHKKDHWSVLQNKKFPVDRALEHFDDFYKTVYGSKWPSIRLALLSPHKYCAVLNNYGALEDTMTQLECIGALNVRKLFTLEKEQIRLKKEETKRQKELDEVFALDKRLEDMMLSKQQAEIQSIYPQRDGSEDSVAPDIIVNSTSNSEQQESQEELGATVPGISLESSLQNAEIDTHRIIDPSAGFSAAALYEYVPATKLKGMEEWIPESQHYGYYKKETDFPIRTEKDYDLLFPEYLQVYSFEQGNISSFPSPKRDATGVLNYYMLDGASLLPVLALGLKMGDRVLDMCAGPGGKSFITLQTLFPAYLVCNDISDSRGNRIRQVFKQFLHDMKDWENKILITRKDGRTMTDYNVYNKILVDVPCTTDRHSLHENDNNIFSPARTKERLQMPEMQSELLSQALKLVRPGGTVVYSTCSLSPIQNDGVVHMALKKIWEETDVEIVVKDMAPALQQVQCIFKLGENIGLRYGHIVLPFLPCNFGPMYFCKLVRTK